MPPLQCLSLPIFPTLDAQSVGDVHSETGDLNRCRVGLSGTIPLHINISEAKMSFSVESKWILGYENHYFATTEGDILTCKKWGGDEPKKLSPQPNNYGYPQVCLCLDGVVSKRQVHIIVLETFVGPKPSRHHRGLHKDDNKLNNHVDNLYWGTPEQNFKDAIVNGGILSGSGHFNSRLTKDQVLEVRGKCERYIRLDDLSKNAAYHILAREYGVSPYTIRNIIVGKNYSDVTEQ